MRGNMAKSSNQKLKLMYLMKIMLEMTDETHSITMNEIIDILNSYWINAEHKSLYNDIENLRNYGIDIIGVQKERTYYYNVVIECENSLVGVMIDRFGKEITIISKEDEHFIINVQVVTSRQFLAWIIGLGNGAKIIEPEFVVEQMHREIDRLIEQYRK